MNSKVMGIILIGVAVLLIMFLAFENAEEWRTCLETVAYDACVESGYPYLGSFYHLTDDFSCMDEDRDYDDLQPISKSEKMYCEWKVKSKDGN